ncbi:hypothetical protein K0M31_012839 [Melipona bicolor]|uniref:Uncharacterized protein n=1 Tax=Melipona bicolor TaxID=60889 RepID=A0AA40FJS7_9HYME|nr:hypothetical protein K0M31_012839 [Melipona bicolor]
MPSAKNRCRPLLKTPMLAREPRVRGLETRSVGEKKKNRRRRRKTRKTAIRLKIDAGGGKTRPDGEKPVADCEASVADSENLMPIAEDPLWMRVIRCRWRKAQFSHERTEADSEIPEANDEGVPSPTRQTVPDGERPMQTGRNIKADSLKPRRTTRERISRM